MSSSALDILCENSPPAMLEAFCPSDCSGVIRFCSVEQLISVLLDLDRVKRWLRGNWEADPTKNFFYLYVFVLLA